MIRCTVCGQPGDNLSVPFGRCLPCIKAASVAWEAKVAVARQRPAETPKSSRPVFLQVLRPDRAPRLFSAPVHGDPRHRIQGLLRTLNHAPEGQRNATLHWVACRLGEMVVAGELPDPQRAADALAKVAEGTGLGPSEVRGTIRSGLSKSGVGR